MAGEKFYITTAIDYVNQKPHLGTAYEKIGADCMARYKRLRGFDTYFLMGTDEHSTNVEKEAVKRGLEPKKYCDEMSERFQSTWKKLEISYDDFIRTTEGRHLAAVLDLFKKIDDNGYIYKGKYEGIYCESCEEFLNEKDLVDGLCPVHRIEPKVIKEENYFFSLSLFEKPLLEHIEKHPDFVQPKIRAHEVINVIRGGLDDVSISRVGKKWGIPLPSDEGHVVYVWFDALINYISALGFGGDDTRLFERYWPADVHVVGKDITRFHCIIWPAMLMAADVQLPRQVYAHGFVSLEGEKMSKTRGNVIDPEKMAEAFGADGLRYLLMREVPFDKDGDISVESLVTRYNSDLANELGNLFSRTLAMISKYFGGELSGVMVPNESQLKRELEEAITQYYGDMDRMAFSRAITGYWSIIQRANRYIEEKRPWDLARDESKRDELASVMAELVMVLRSSGVILFPFMPVKMADMLTQLGVGKPDMELLPFDSMEVSGIAPARPLFPRIDSIPDNLA